MKPTALDINPDVLRWARREGGLSPKGAADRLNLDIDDIYRWEKDGKQVPLSALEKMADCYQRQLAVFFLPKPPPPLKMPLDRRNLKSSNAIGGGP